MGKHHALDKDAERTVEYHGIISGLFRGKLFTIHEHRSPHKHRSHHEHRHNEYRYDGDYNNQDRDSHNRDHRHSRSSGHDNRDRTQSRSYASPPNATPYRSPTYDPPRFPAQAYRGMGGHGSTHEAPGYGRSVTYHRPASYNRSPSYDSPPAYGCSPAHGCSLAHGRSPAYDHPVNAEPVYDAIPYNDGSYDDQEYTVPSLPASNQPYSNMQSSEMPNKGRPWTSADDNLLLSLVRAGKTSIEAVPILGRPIQELRNREMDLDQQAKKTSSVSSPVTKTATPAVRSWTSAEDGQLLRLADEGKTSTNVTDFLGRTIEEVRKRRLQLSRIANNASSGTSSVTKTATPAVRSWTSSEDNQLLKLADEGKTLTYVASSLGRTIEEVRERRLQVTRIAAKKAVPGTSTRGPPSSVGGTKARSRVNPLWSGGQQLPSRSGARSLAETNSSEDLFLEQKRQEEFMVKNLSRQYTLPRDFYDTVKPDLQFSAMDCKLLALLEQKHANSNTWTDLQADFLAATGNFVGVQQLRQALACGGYNDFFSAQHYRTLSYLHRKQEENKWRAIQSEFSTGTGRTVDVKALKEKLGKV